MECKGTIWAGDINMEMYLSQKTGWFRHFWFLSHLLSMHIWPQRPSPCRPCLFLGFCVTCHPSLAPWYLLLWILSLNPAPKCCGFSAFCCQLSSCSLHALPGCSLLMASVPTEVLRTLRFLSLELSFQLSTISPIILGVSQVPWVQN